MKNSKKVLVSLGVCIGVFAAVCVFALMAIGILLEIGYIPDTKVLIGSEVSKKSRQTLVDLKLIKPNEEILYFYSAGFLSVAEDGNFFTPERVVSYQDCDGEFSVSEARFSEILSIEVESKGGVFEDALLYIETTDKGGFYLLVSTEEGRDKLFIQDLRRVWSDSQVVSEPAN